MKFAVFQNQAVTNLLNRIFAANLPVKTAYKLSKIQKAIGVEAERYHSLRIGVVKKYAEVDEKGELIVNETGNAKISDENVPLLIAELDELHNLDVDMPDLIISIDDLEKVELSASDLSLLDMLGIISE